MSNSVAALNAALLQQQLNIILKPHGHGGGHAPAGQKFSDLAQVQMGIPFVAPQAPRAATPVVTKQASRKDRKSRDQADESEDESRTPQRRAQGHSAHVDVTV
jgi:hypothetical protein